MKDVHEQQINLTLEMWGLVYRLLYITPSLEVGFFFSSYPEQELKLGYILEKAGEFFKTSRPRQPQTNE